MAAPTSFHWSPFVSYCLEQFCSYIQYTFLNTSLHKIHVTVLTRKHNTHMHFIWKILVFTSYCVTTAKVKAVLVTLQLYLPVMAGWALELGPKEVVTVTTWWLFHRPANQPVLSPLSLSLSLSHTHTHTQLPNCAYRTSAPNTLELRSSLTSEIRFKFRATKCCSYREIWRAERSCWSISSSFRHVHSSPAQAWTYRRWH